MISNSDNVRNEEYNVLKLIVESGKYSDNPTLQRFYYQLIQYEQNPIEYTEFLFGIILNTNESDSNFRRLDEKEQKCFIIYFKNWLSKLQNLEDINNVQDIHTKTLSLIKYFLFDLNSVINSTNKNFFIEIFKILFSIMTSHSGIQSMKKNFTEIKTEIKSCIINFNPDSDFLRVRDFLIVIDAIAISEAKVSKTTSELSDYFEILNFLFDFFNSDSNESKLINDRLIILTSLITTFCKISSKFMNDTFKIEEMLKHIHSNLNRNNFSQSDSISISTSYDKCKEPFFNTEVFVMIVNKILILNRDLKFFKNISEDEITKNILIIPNYNYNVNFDLNNTTLSFSQIIELDLLKSHVVDLISNMTDFLNINNIFEHFEKFKNLCKSMTCDIIKNLSSSEIKIDERTENSKEETIMIKCHVRLLEFLINQVQTSAGASIFSDNKLEIFRYIIVPNLKTTELERELFLIEPEEFMNTLNDMSSKQQSKSPKVKSLKLIDIMCEYIDSFLKFITEFYTDIIKYIIYKSKAQKHELASDVSYVFSVITDSKVQSLFSDYINTIEDEELLEQSLQIFASVSYLIFDRLNIRNLFEDKIDSVNHILIELKDEFIKAKLCNFYAFTLDDMYHDKTKVFSKSFYDSMNFLVSCILNENKNISLNFIALDSLYSIIFDESMKDIVSDFVKLNIRSILNLINIPYFNELTSNPLFFKTVKNLIAIFFYSIEDDVFYIFNFFWSGIQKQIEERIINSRINNEDSSMIKISGQDGVLKERNFKLLDKMQSLISLIETCVKKCRNVENKSLIFNEILKLLQYLDSFINYEYEEEILEMIQIVLNDLKLIPNLYIGCLVPLIHKFSINNDNDKNHVFKFEEYHVGFIFNILNNMREEHFLQYKDKRLSLVPHKQQDISKNEKENLSVVNLLIVYIIFYWDYLSINDIYDEKSNDECNKIINLLKICFIKRTIMTEELIKRILFVFYLTIIKIDSAKQDIKLKNFQNLEIFLIKSISVSGRDECAEENAISSIFASKMILLLFKTNQTAITQYNDLFKEKPFTNYIKHLINFNIDHLLFLRKEAMSPTDKDEIDVTNTDLNENLFTNELCDEKDERDIGVSHKDKLHKENMKMLITGKEFIKKRKTGNFYLDNSNKRLVKKTRMKDYDFELDEISQDDSDDEGNSDSSRSNYGDEDDILDEILNENNMEDDDDYVNENDDKDQEFVKIKKSEKNDIHNFIKNFSAISFKNLMQNVNEFKLFDSVLNYIHQNNQSFYDYILSNFTKTKLKVLESIRHFQKISGKEGTRFRKILKIKRK